MFLRKKKSPEEAELDKRISAMKSKDVQESLSAVTAVINLCLKSPELKKTYLHTLLPKLLEDRNTRARTRAAFTLTGLLFSSSDLRKDLIRYVVELLTEHKDQAMMLHAAAVLGRIAEMVGWDPTQGLQLATCPGKVERGQRSLRGEGYCGFAIAGDRREPRHGAPGFRIGGRDCHYARIQTTEEARNKIEPGRINQ